MSNSKKYAADLQELKTQFYLILERYKKAYPPYAANPNEENTTIYLASKSQLDNIFKDLVLLENNVNSSSGVLTSSSSGLDTNIDKLHKQYNYTYRYTENSKKRQYHQNSVCSKN